MHSFPVSRPASTHLVRMYGYSQTELLGSENCDTAVAVMAAHALMHADGHVWDKFDTDEDILRVISSGIVWHSRYVEKYIEACKSACYADGIPRYTRFFRGIPRGNICASILVE